ncbi:MAG: helix-turn-helix domain-containing protein [Bacteroidota bacterium]
MPTKFDTISAKNWSQGELADEIEASRAIIGKYERNENIPSIEMVIKMSKAFDVSMDFLLGEGEYASYDKDTIRRIQDIEKLDSNTRTKIFDIIDTYLRNAKTKQAYGV